MKHLKVLVKFFLFSLVSKGNCFWCYIRQLFLYLYALRKCKKDCKILKIIVVVDFCQLKTEIV